MLFEFSKCKLSNRYYGGSEKKLGILIDGEPYMLKFQKKDPFSYHFNHMSEYVGSHIFEMLGFDVHHTILGTYKGENVVACKDFLKDGLLFVPFNDIGESTIEEDKSKYQYSYEDIIILLEKNKKITNVSETISSFFDIYIVDALLGNFDRHGANWGFLKRENKYTLAPVFDNGSCLFPQMWDENEMLYILNNEKEIDERIYKFPTSKIKMNNKKSSYFDVISSNKFEECNKSLIKIYKKINLQKINAFIDNIENLSEVHKRFYKVMLEQRYKKIIEFSYNKLKDK